jgi:hypothetical protein
VLGAAARVLLVCRCQLVIGDSLIWGDDGAYRVEKRTFSASFCCFLEQRARGTLRSGYFWEALLRLACIVGAQSSFRSLYM